jgi:hypothetical protein
VQKTKSPPIRDIRFGGLSISMIAFELAVTGRCRHVRRVMMMVAVMREASHLRNLL